MNSFDVVVIGAGPAGYVAALRCAQLGLNTACVDNWFDEQGQHQAGGSCVNVGCIPSKALLDSSQLYSYAQHELAEHGIQIQDLKLNLDAMQQRKQQIVNEVSQRIKQRLQQNVSLIAGTAQVLTGLRVQVTSVKGEVSVLEAQHIILATGSRPRELPQAVTDGRHIVNSTGGLAFEQVPKTLGIIGGGVVALELGSIWSRLGAQVTLLEAQDRFLSFADQDISAKALDIFRLQGLDIRLEARVVSAESVEGQVQLSYQDREGSLHQLQFDKLIVAGGRQPYSDNLISPEVPLVFGDGGFVHVNEKCETSQPGIYAIGDLVRGPMLAHRGMQEALMLASRLAGKAGDTNYETIPSVIYTQPGIAWVGATERELQQRGEDYKIGSFPFSASSRAAALQHGEGYIKVLAHAQTDRILGVHIIGDGAPELIAEAVIAMEFEASSEDIALTVFAHPTLSEAFREAAMAVNGHPLHTY